MPQPEAPALTFLGTGTSVGVPVIGCHCSVCKSPDPRNKRTRASILISSSQGNILVDTGPDLRIQALRENLSSIEAVLYTHPHLDHVVGFDELRAFCWGKTMPLPLYATHSTLHSLKTMFAWAFQESNNNSGYVKPDPRPITSSFNIADLTITPLPVLHASVETIGFLFHTKTHFSCAYIPDVKTIPPETLNLLQNLDILILDSLRQSPHSTHLSLPEALNIITQLQPKQTYLTHLSCEFDHSLLSASLPPNICPAHDGLKIPLH